MTDAQIEQPDPDAVFVVHGRDMAGRDSMFTFLRAIGLKPIEWSTAVSLTGEATPYIGQVLDAAFGSAQAIVVLMTPDEVAYLRPELATDAEDGKPAAQARPNVLFEAGMALGRNPKRTVLVELGRVRPFSDVGGRHAVRIDNSAQARKDLAQRLDGAGCPVDLTGNDWLTAGDFTPMDEPGGGLPLGRKVPPPAIRPASIDGRWLARGGNKIDRIVFTNGPVDLFDVTVEIPKDVTGVQLWDNDKPLPKLPAGKTFSVNGISASHHWNSVGPRQFELDVVAHLEDGTPFRQPVYLDSSR